MAGVIKGKLKKVAIFGGSFDPVHLGHVALVVGLKEAHDLDLVYIIPASYSPHKTAQIPLDAKQRVSMLKKAFHDLSYCQILDLEITRKGPSYTIDTVHELLQNSLIQSSDKLYLLLGDDQLASFATWKDVHALTQLAQPLVARRYDIAIQHEDPALQACLQAGLTTTAYFEISSTDIRQRRKKGLYCGHLLDGRVYKYILKQKLYE